MKLDKPLKTRTAAEPSDPPALLFAPDLTDLDRSKRRLSRMIDGELDDLTPIDALALLNWLHDDAEARRIETEGETCAAAK